MMKRLSVVFGLMLLCAVLSACSRQMDLPPVSTDSTESLETSLQTGAHTTAEPPQQTLHQHRAAEAVQEHEVDATCKSVGSYERVVYCADCGEELERMAQELPKVDHRYQQDLCVYCGTQKSSVGLSFRSNGDGTCYVSGMGSCKDEDLVIPSTSPAGDTVVGIGDSAFYNRIGLFSVQLPDTLEYIGTNAFALCPNIQSFSLSSSLKSVGAGAFGDIG